MDKIREILIRFRKAPAKETGYYGHHIDQALTQIIDTIIEELGKVDISGLLLNMQEELESEGHITHIMQSNRIKCAKAILSDLKTKLVKMKGEK